MILAFDIGNTHIVPVFFDDNGNIIESFRIPTNLLMTEDTLFSIIKTLTEYKDIDLKNIDRVVVSSVVPHLNEIFSYLSKKYFNVNPVFVTLNRINNEIILPPDTERGLGADRIIDILHAKTLYPDKELVIIDFGTAITFDVIKDSIYLGGCILPGIELSIEALFKNTAKLPKVYFQEPSTIFGKNTINQINAGIYYSNIGGIKEILSQYTKGLQAPFVIATGGQGKNISEVIEDINLYIPDLTINGLYTFAKMFS